MFDGVNLNFCNFRELSFGPRSFGARFSESRVTATVTGERLRKLVGHRQRPAGVRPSFDEQPVTSAEVSLAAACKTRKQFPREGPRRCYLSGLGLRRSGGSVQHAGRIQVPQRGAARRRRHARGLSGKTCSGVSQVRRDIVSPPTMGTHDSGLRTRLARCSKKEKVDDVRKIWVKGLALAPTTMGRPARRRRGLRLAASPSLMLS